MSRIVCPGQDTRFWTKNDIFDVECARCGYDIEFFKDDASRRCPHCGTRVGNPRLSLGCAQWCEHAEKCLGFDPKSITIDEDKEASLADKLIEAIKAHFAGDQERITHALLVLERAQELLRHEDANPRVVVAAALLHDIGIHDAERRQELEGPPVARCILEALELDEKTIQHVCRIVDSHGSASDVDTPESRVVWDADWLVKLAEERNGMGEDERRQFIERTFRTESGRSIAVPRFLSTDT